MSQTLSVTEVAHHFAEYIDRVAYPGESFVLVRGNKPIAELRPLPAGQAQEAYARAIGLSEDTAVRDFLVSQASAAGPE